MKCLIPETTRIAANLHVELVVDHTVEKRVLRCCDCEHADSSRIRKPQPRKRYEAIECSDGDKVANKRRNAHWRNDRDNRYD